MSWPSRLIFLRVVALQCLAVQSSFDENLFWMGLVKLKLLKFLCSLTSGNKSVGNFLGHSHARTLALTGLLAVTTRTAHF